MKFECFEKPDTEYAKRCIAAMDNELELATIALECINDYKFKIFPSVPQIVFEWRQYTKTDDYKALPLEKKTSKLKIMMLDQQFMKYINAEAETKTENDKSLTFLKDIIEIFAKNNKPEQVQLIAKTINTHVNGIKPYRAA